MVTPSREKAARGETLTKVVRDEMRAAHKSLVKVRQAIYELWRDELYLDMGFPSFHQWASHTIGEASSSRLRYLLQLGKAERELLDHDLDTGHLSERALEAIRDAPDGARIEAYRHVCEAAAEAGKPITGRLAKKVVREKFAETVKVKPHTSDQAGNLCTTPAVAEAFQTRAKLKALQRQFTATMNELSGLVGTPGTDHINVANIKVKVGQILREIERGLPHYVCVNPDCDGRGCGACLQLGWITKTRFEEIDPNDPGPPTE